MKGLRKMLGAYWLLLLLPAVLLIPGMGGFPFPAVDAPFSDVLVSHYPNALYLKRALQDYTAIPLWSPQILSGQPFAANPLSGLWYPLGWLALVFPLPLGFNLLTALHLVWGGVGLARLLLRQGLGEKAALLGGLVFSLMPKLFAHFGAGHLTLVYAVPWTPWLLLAASGERERWFNQPGLIMGLIFLADVRWAAYSGLLWLGWQFVYGQKTWVEKGKAWGLQLGLAFLIAAPQGLPLLEFTRLSTRAALTTTEVFEFSLPPERLLGLLFPDFGGFHEYTLYPGVVVLILALAAGLGRGTRFWWGLVGVSLLYALGENLPGLNLLASLPGFSLLRVPPRVLFLAGLGFAALAANGFERLQQGLEEKPMRRLRLTLAGLTAFSLTLAVGLWAMGEEFPPNIGWAALGCGAMWLGLGLLNKAASQRAWVVVVFLLLVLDLVGVNQSLFTYHTWEDEFSEPEMAAAAYLAAQPGDFRSYSSSYSTPQHIAAWHELKLVDGVDPLQLQSYADFIDRATGVPRVGYSVTLPPFGDPDLAIANQDYVPAPELLAMLDVGYVVSAFEIEHPLLRLEKQFSSVYVYRSLARSPESFIWPEGEVLWSPNRIELTASGPGTFALSEVAYPGWQVYIDGERVEMLTVMDLLRGVKLPAGSHRVEFVFRPVSVYIGLGLAALGAVSLVVIERRGRRW